MIECFTFQFESAPPYSEPLRAIYSWKPKGVSKGGRYYCYFYRYCCCYRYCCYY